MVRSQLAVSDEELLQISSKNPEMRFERNADGTLAIMPPTGFIASNREARVIGYLLVWIEQKDLGEVFSTSTGFRLENGAIRSPDAAFISRQRLTRDWDGGEDSFLSIAPDFAIEVRAKTDSLKTLQAKMREYIENGVKLGWLCDRQNQQVWLTVPMARSLNIQLVPR